MAIRKRRSPKPLIIAAKPTPSFWLVWCDRYNSTPHRKHETRDSAAKEAERLAGSNPGHRFYVLPATEYATASINPVAWSTDPPDEDRVPF